MNKHDLKQSTTAHRYLEVNILHAKRHPKNLWVEWVVFTILPINKGYDRKGHERNGIQCD